MKQCDESVTVKFHMELLLTTATRKQSRCGATPLYAPPPYMSLSEICLLTLLKVIIIAPLKKETKRINFLPKSFQETVR